MSKPDPHPLRAIMLELEAADQRAFAARAPPAPPATRGVESAKEVFERHFDVYKKKKSGV